MTKRGDRGSGASVRTRLLALSKERGEEFQRVLVRFGIERLLYRLSRSEHASGFVLKGATLFAVWRVTSGGSSSPAAGRSAATSTR